MVLEIKDTVANTIQVFDDGTTLADIMRAMGYMNKEKERWARRNKQRSTGKPPGRPRKIIPPGEV